MAVGASDGVLCDDPHIGIGRGNGSVAREVADATRVDRSASYSRSCTGEDLPGIWSLVTFDSSYRFKNPQAPYLFPYQLFHYSREQGAKSAHSRTPIFENSERVFEAVPLDLTYRVEPGGRVVLKTKEQGAVVEVWSCSVVGHDPRAKDDRTALRRGDVVMTLLGSHGQPLFVRHLRKSPA